MPHVVAGQKMSVRGIDATRAIEVTLEPCPAPIEIESQWRDLENDGTPSFFLSWTWIGCWLEGLEPRHRPWLLRATRQQRTVGLAILVPNRCTRLRVLPSTGLHLHATGEKIHDDICIENNGLLVCSDESMQIEVAMLSFLCSSEQSWDQIHFSLLAKRPPTEAFTRTEMLLRQEDFTSYFVDLAELRNCGKDYLSQLSSNTRSQIRRCIKGYAKVGVVTLTVANNRQQALLFFNRLKVLHQKTWTSRGAPGAFANPRFEDFHQRLIDRGFERGEVQLLRASAGDQDIGYLYNFIHRGRIYCYQSGFSYGLTQGNDHPGLATHALAIQHCIESGYEIYDFLAGDARYKSQLASNNYQMISSSAHRNTLSLRLEMGWRYFKNMVAGHRLSGR